MADLGAIGTGYASTNYRMITFEPSAPTLQNRSTNYRMITFEPSASTAQNRSTNYKMVLFPTNNGGIGVKHSYVLASKTIQIWSNRANYTMAPAGSMSQVYLQDNPGTISGTVKTAGVADAFYTVRLYYRPNGYLIDQIRTNLDGTFTFSKDIDKAEIKNYYVMAFDANGTANAVVYDLITAG